MKPRKRQEEEVQPLPWLVPPHFRSRACTGSVMTGCLIHSCKRAFALFEAPECTPPAMSLRQTKSLRGCCRSICPCTSGATTAREKLTRRDKTVCARKIPLYSCGRGYHAELSSQRSTRSGQGDTPKAVTACLPSVCRVFAARIQRVPGLYPRWMAKSSVFADLP